MVVKTRTNLIIWGIACILSIFMAINSIVDNKLGFFSVSIFCFAFFLRFFVVYFKMIGKTYFFNNSIIKEAFGKKLINTIDDNLRLKFGIYAIGIFNQTKIYLDKENDTNNVIENIYTYIKKSITQNDIVFPVIHRRDNYTISFIYIFLAVIGFIIYFFLIRYNINSLVKICILLLSIIFFTIAIITFIPKRKFVLDRDKITTYNVLNQKSIIPIIGIEKIETNIVSKKLVLIIYYGKKKAGIELNVKTNFKNIQNIYLLENYYNEGIKNNGHFA